MPSERVQRQIDRLLDEAEHSISINDWDAVRERSRAALALDPGNADALTYIEAAGPEGHNKCEAGVRPLRGWAGRPGDSPDVM